MALSRAYTSAKAVDVAKLLLGLLNDPFMQNIVRPQLPVTVTLS